MTEEDKKMTSASIRGCLLAVILTVPGWSQTLQTPVRQGPAPHPARPGSINYVEGQAALGTTTLDASCVGILEMERDQPVTTEAGKVEILLTPGVFLRLADNGSVKMISPGFANTQLQAKTELQLDKGRALVEVIDVRKENDIAIDLNGSQSRLLKPGLYDFDAVRNEVRVFHGAAEVDFEGHTVKLEGDQKMALAGEHLKAAHFDSRPFEDEFYRWNGLRSGYLSEASVSAARGYIGEGAGLYAPNWVGAERSEMGWYWNSWFGVYTFLPVDGAYYGPFGWGFYSPIEVFRSPFIFYGNYPHSFAELHYPYGHGFTPPAGRGGRIGR
jgi:hypothetical protein